MIATPSPGVYTVEAIVIGGVTRNPPIHQISFPPIFPAITYSVHVKN